MWRANRFLDRLTILEFSGAPLLARPLERWVRRSPLRELRIRDVPRSGSAEFAQLAQGSLAREARRKRHPRAGCPETTLSRARLSRDLTRQSRSKMAESWHALEAATLKADAFARAY